MSIEQTTPGIPDGVAFHAEWRSYQSRVLSELGDYLDDNRLHVVAAPGSGKTVLGLEVIRRLGRPTLVLAPTLTIRDQWLDRFVDMFLPPGSERPDWLSTDLWRPGILTATTYQALHCACSGEQCEELGTESEEENGEDGGATTNGEAEQTASPPSREDELVDALRRAGIATLAVDEAHHLRSKWWESLISVAAKLERPTTVALTATPPYDVSEFEWQRYRELCGPVDAEISAPELVREGNLCPHQDYVYLNLPSAEERERLRLFREEVASLVRDLTTNEEFVSALEAHPWLTFPEKHIEQILDDPDYFSSIAIFINTVRGRVSRELLRVLCISRKSIPPLDLRWLEILLRGRLFTDATNIGEWDPMLKLIRERLSRIGCAERKQVYLRSTPRLDRLLTTSINKLDSIAEIVRFEHSALTDHLRLVVLTDYIRASEMPDGPHDLKPLSRMGVVPVFEKIRRVCPTDIRLGVLSGSHVIVPKASEMALRRMCEEDGIDWSGVTLFPLWQDDRYCKLIMQQGPHRAVDLVTRLFSEGEITALVGTKSLLGEGWDAPCVNTLILASFVGSYMLSNQMRGRAVRVEPGNPGKTANVWHLVCVEPASNGAGADMETLTRRFKAFVGVSFRANVIENGIERLDLGEARFDERRVAETNTRMRTAALDRAGLARKWDESLVTGGPGRMVSEVKGSRKQLPRKYVMGGVANSLGWQALVWHLFWLCVAISDNSGLNTNAAKFLLAATGLIALPFSIVGLVLAGSHWRTDSSMRQVGLALMRALWTAEAIKTPLDRLRVGAHTTPGGSVTCSLYGATSRESAVFLDALQELLDPVDNPRYMLVREPWYNASRWEDCHAVPSVLGRQKEWAEAFAREWRGHVGKMRLVYTRTIEGRHELLRARESGLGVSDLPRSERVSCWR